MVGFPVGIELGIAVGDTEEEGGEEGEGLGAKEGELVGDSEGRTVGEGDNDWEGAAVGGVGMMVGCGEGE